MIKVLSLFSGSLASRVATRLVERHPDVESVCLLYFRSPFARESEALRQLIREEWAGVPLRTQSLKREYQRLVGSTEEPFSLTSSCLSCRRLLVARATRYMERIGAEFLVTGEVLGENGVGRRDLMDLSKSFGLKGRILRPLCTDDPVNPPDGLAGWSVPANGRGKRSSVEVLVRGLAEDLGIEASDPMTCRARCKLTLPGFGDRVSHLFHEAGFTLNELRLLDFPWYYEVRPDTKIVVAMDDQEKKDLQNLFLPQDIRVYPAAPHGPMTLARTMWDSRGSKEREAVIRLAARVTATHLGVEATSPIPIYYRFENENERHLINVEPFTSCSEIGRLDGVDVVPLEAPTVSVG